MEDELEELDFRIPVRCTWCGWSGEIGDLDMDERDSPAYCPECGHGNFDIKMERKEKHG